MPARRRKLAWGTRDYWLSRYLRWTRDLGLRFFLVSTGRTWHRRFRHRYSASRGSYIIVCRGRNRLLLPGFRLLLGLGPSIDHCRLILGLGPSTDHCLRTENCLRIENCLRTEKTSLVDQTHNLCEADNWQKIPLTSEATSTTRHRGTYVEVREQGGNDYIIVECVRLCGLNWVL